MARRMAATERTRRAIRAALIRLLGSRPYSSITMAEIAAVADVSVRTVQRHYASKDELLVDACLIEPEEAITNVTEKASALSAEQALAALVRSQFEFYDRHRVEYRAVHTRAVDAPSVQQALRRAEETRLSRITDLVGRQPNAWQADADPATRVLAGMTCYQSWRAFTEMAGLSNEEAATVAGDMLCAYLLRR